MQVVVYVESAGDTLLVENDVINVNHINNLFLSLRASSPLPRFLYWWSWHSQGSTLTLTRSPLESKIS